MKLSTIKPNPKNPRVITGEQFERLKKSIQEFPKMMQLRPMVVNSEGYILGGNMRFKALHELGYKDIPDEWVKRAEDLTEAEMERFIIADNVSLGDWDNELLKEDWDAEQLAEWGLDGFEIIENDYFDITDTGQSDGSYESSLPRASDDNYSTFELVMLHENKLTLLDTLNKVKSNFLFERTEEALMEIVRGYNQK